MKRAIVLVILGTSAAAAADPKEEAQAVLDQWVHAFDAGDQKALLVLYDKTFVATKTLANGKTKTLKLAQWKKDQKPLFKKAEVEVSGIAIESASADDATIKFEHRWAQGTKAAHGERTLTLHRNAAGALAIVGETVAAPSAGWEDVKGKRATMAVGRKVTVKVMSDKPFTKVGNCTRGTFKMNVKTEQGQDTLEVGEGVSPGNEDVAVSMMDDGTLFYWGRQCDGAGASYQVRRRGDAIYVMAKTAKDAPWTTLYFLAFFEGAKIKATTQADEDAALAKRQNGLD